MKSLRLRVGQQAAVSTHKLAARQIPFTSPNNVPCWRYTQHDPYLCSPNAFPLISFKRLSSSSSGLQSAHQPLYFHSSRPDFLPSTRQNDKHPVASKEGSTTIESVIAPASDVLSQHDDEQFRRRRYIPQAKEQLKIPSKSDTHSSYLELWEAVTLGRRETIWRRFIPHFQKILRAEEEDQPIDLRLFDAVFWSVAAEQPDSLERHHEVYNRTRLLFEYSQVKGIELSRRQFQRYAYQFISIWEQLAVCRQVFVDEKHSRTLIQGAADLDGRLVSRLLSRLSTTFCFEEARVLVESWHREANNHRPRRHEDWTEEAEREEIFGNEHIDSLSWEHFLENLVKFSKRENTYSAEYASLGVLILSQGKLSPSLSIVLDFFAKVLPLKQLRTFMLTSASQDEQNSKRTKSGSVSTLSLHVSCPEFEQVRQIYKAPIAMALARRGDFTQAISLLEAREQESARRLQESETNNLFGECAHLASFRARLVSNHTIAIDWLRLALRFYRLANWRLTHLHRVLARSMIRGYARFMLLPITQRRVFLKDEECFDLLRQMTVVTLNEDPSLTTLFGEGKNGVFQLLRQLIAAHDYTFSKKVFRITRSYEVELEFTPFLSPDFLWLFHQAVKKNDLEFAMELFRHWLWSDLSTTTLPHLPFTLLDRFIQRLMHNGQQDIVLFLRDQLLESVAEERISLSSVQRLIETISCACVDHQERADEFLRLILQASDGLYGVEAQTKLFALVLRLRAGPPWLTPSSQDALLDQFSTFRTKLRQAIASWKGEHVTLEELKKAFASAFQILFNELARLQKQRPRRRTDETRQQKTLAEAIRMMEELQCTWQLSLNEPPFASQRIEFFLYLGQPKAALAHWDKLIEEHSKAPVDASIVCRMCLALGEAGYFEEASHVLARYDKLADTHQNNDRLLMECASLALLCMKDEAQDAVFCRLRALAHVGLVWLPQQLDESKLTMTPPVTTENNWLWQGSQVQRGEWNGLLRRTRSLIVQWLRDDFGGSLDMKNIGKDGLSVRSHQQRDGLGLKDSLRAEAFAALASGRAWAPSRTNQVEKQSQGDLHQDWKEKDKRRREAFEALASGRAWKA